VESNPQIFQLWRIAMELVVITIIFLAFCITIIALNSQDTIISELAIKMLGKLSKALLPSPKSDDDDKKPKTA
jgi:hypothetical protein